MEVKRAAFCVVKEKKAPKREMVRKMFRMSRVGESVCQSGMAGCCQCVVIGFRYLSMSHGMVSLSGRWASCQTIKTQYVAY